jgi:DNA-binding transcriptional LysR family regulator
MVPFTYFRAAARLGHLGRAAEELGIAQPTLSRSIKQLERRYGVLLFDRIGRTVRLNANGRTLLPLVEQALQAIDDADRAMQDLSAVAGRRISVGFIGSLGTRGVPAFIDGFRSLEPAVDFQLRQAAPPILFDLLRKGELDFCFGFAGEPQPDILGETLWYEELFLHVPPNHRFVGRQDVDLAEAAGEQFVCLKPGAGLRAINEELCAEAGFAPQIAFEGQTLVMLRGLISVGFGIMLAPDTEGPADHDVARIRVRKPNCMRPIILSRLRKRYLSQIALRFADFVTEKAKSAWG